MGISNSITLIRTWVSVNYKNITLTTEVAISLSKVCILVHTFLKKVVRFLAQTDDYIIEKSSSGHLSSYKALSTIIWQNFLHTSIARQAKVLTSILNIL